MSVQVRLTVMNFLQFFVWGSWLISLGGCMIMTNGLGAFVGGTASGLVVDHFTTNGVRVWPRIWLTFAGYALILGIVFPLVFKYRHDPEKKSGQSIVNDLSRARS